MTRFLSRLLIFIIRTIVVVPFLFLRWLYRLIGHGYFARFLYALIASCALLYCYLGIRTYGFDAADRQNVFAYAAVFWIGFTFITYQIMHNFDRLSESPFIRSVFSLGKGGSARWGGSSTYSKYEHRSNGDASIYLGRSIAKLDVKPGGRIISVDDESHMITFGQSGSGKSTTAIWPNLVKYPYPDSVVVLDPKGEHAESTAMARQNLGHKVVIFDPMAETNGLSLSRFNPLAELDINSPNIKEDIIGIANACAVDESSDGTSAHFTETFIALFSGLIAHVMTTEPKQNQTLPQVYDLFHTLRGAGSLPLLEAMARNPACGNLAADGAMMLDAAGKNERGSLINTCLRNISWIGSDGMRSHLQSSDFTLSDLRSRIVSLYVVLPFDKMDYRVQGRYMRVLLYLAFKACRNHPLPAARSRRRTLFILDEVSMLGPMPELEKASKTLRGSNVKLWTLYQQYSGLSDQVKDVHAMTGNATKQFFGCNDPVTAAEIEKYLGEYKHQDQTREIKRSLLDSTEILDYLGLDDMVQIVITSQGDKMQLKREGVRLSRTQPQSKAVRDALSPDAIQAKIPKFKRSSRLQAGRDDFDEQYEKRVPKFVPRK